VPIGKCVVNACYLDARGSLEAKALSLVLLGIREAGVDGKYQRRVARVKGLRRGSESQALSRGIPQDLVKDVREARRLEAGTVLLESITGKDKAGSVIPRGPRSHALVGLADGLGGKGAVRAVIIQLVDAGIDLAAHCVAGHGEKPANACLPRHTCRCVQNRNPMERLREAARKALCRSDANAHASKAAGTATDENAVEVAHGVAAVLKRREGRGDQLDVGLAPAHVVSRGKDSGSHAGLPGDHRTRKHVRRCINGKGKPLAAGIARHSHLTPETWHYHEG
jgi:hypothetical protein